MVDEIKGAVYRIGIEKVNMQVTFFLQKIQGKNMTLWFLTIPFVMNNFFQNCLPIAISDWALLLVKF